MRILICDDEKPIQTYIARLVRARYPDSEILCCSSAGELLDICEEIDLLFLDIQMPEISGMEAAQELRRRGSRAILIFITALEQYVFQAFDVSAFHYLVKPFSEKKFQEVLTAAVREYEERKGETPQMEERCLMIQHHGVHFRVKLSDIVYAEVYNRKVILHVRSSDDSRNGTFVRNKNNSSETDERTEEIIYYGRLGELEAEAGADFFRSHRSYLVNFKYVERYDAASVWLEYGGHAMMAKKSYPEFVKRFLQYNKRTRNQKHE